MTDNIAPTGWECCKPRVLTFDEFLAIPPCTTGKHSTVDDTPQPKKKPAPPEEAIPAPKPVSTVNADATQTAARTSLPIQNVAPPKSPAPPPEDESDDPSISIAPNTSCKRRGCKATYNPDKSRDDETCIHHPGAALFHEGSKGWTCCKRRVLEFDEFMKIEGCKTKNRHLFVGKGRPTGEEKLETVR